MDRTKHISYTVYILFVLAVIGSMLSQLPNIIESGTNRYLQALWILPIIIVIVRIPTLTISKSVLIPIFLTCLFSIFCGICDSILKNRYIGQDMINISMSMIIFIVSYILWKRYGSKTFLNMLNITLLIGAFILSSYVYKYFLSESDIMSSVYAFKAKNSMGQLLFSAILISLLTSRFKYSISNIVKWFVITYTMVVIFMLKSRATLITIFFVVFYFIFKVKNKKLKYYSLFCSIAIILYIIIDSNLYDIIVNGILLNAHELEDVSQINDLNDVSSGRIEYISEVLPLIPDNLWLGVGNRYVDCMPIIMIVQYGLIGASIVFCIIYYFWKSIYKLDRSHNLFLTAFLLLCTYLLNSLFEANPPFGPGAKCFLLWIIVGFSFAEKEINKNIELNENMSNL